MPRKTRKLSLEQLRHLAKAGAEATLHRLRAEIEVLERTFPELASSRGRKQTATAIQQRAWRMSAAARKAVSDRMQSPLPSNERRKSLSPPSKNGGDELKLSRQIVAPSNSVITAEAVLQSLIASFVCRVRGRRLAA